MTAKALIKDYRPKLTTETRDSLFEIANKLGFTITRHGTYHGEPSVRDMLAALAAAYRADNAAVVSALREIGVTASNPTPEPTHD